MIAALLAGLALAGVQPHTAETVPQGEVVVRLPTGPSAVGLTDRDELWIIPLDLGIGGPRLGLEHAWSGERWALSVRPSVGVKSTLRRWSLRVEPTLSWRSEHHLLSAELALDARLLDQVQLLEEGRQHELGLDRLQSHLLLTWDARSKVRTKLRLPVRDRGATLSWASGSVAWTHTREHLYLAAGLGMLVGRPRDQYTLGTYHWWFWLPWPEVDVAWRF